MSAQKGVTQLGVIGDGKDSFFVIGGTDRVRSESNLCTNSAVEGKPMLKRLLDPKAVIFCIAVANMIQVLFQPNDWKFADNFFLSSIVLLSTLLLFIKRLWSNFLAVALTGILPVVFVLGILRLAANAEVSLFGWNHIKLVAELIASIPGVFLLLLVLCVSILACAYCSLSQLVARSKMPSDF